MGVVDSCDQNISSYRIGIRGKKWWWDLFVWVPDMIVQNSWNLYRQYKEDGDPTYDLLQFRREIVNTYLMKYKDIRKPTIPRNKTVERRVPADVRFDGFYHYQDTMTKKSKMRYL